MTQHEELTRAVKQRKAKARKGKPHKRATKPAVAAYVAESLRPGLTRVEAAANVGLTYVPQGKLVQELKQEIVQEGLTAASITFERTAREIARLAYFDPAMCFDENNNLLPITQMHPDARAALEGFEVEKRIEGKGADAVEVFTFKVKHSGSKRAMLDLLVNYLPEWRQRVAEGNAGRGSSGLEPPVINVNFGTINNG